MKVAQNKMVAVHYKLTVDGAVADQSNPDLLLYSLVLLEKSVISTLEMKTSTE